MAFLSPTSFSDTALGKALKPKYSTAYASLANPQSTKSNVTPSATTGMTMKSVAAQSYNPNTKSSSSSSKSSSKKKSSKPTPVPISSNRNMAVGALKPILGQSAIVRPTPVKRPGAIYTPITNEKGYEGLEEAPLLGMSQQSNEQIFKNNLLGINTAQAAEPSMFSTPSNVSIGGNSTISHPQTPGPWADKYIFSSNSDVKTPPPPPTSPTGGAPTGNPTQQFAQGATGGFDNSGYKKQQKAKEKALKELIKSIVKEYSQSQTEGTRALEKSKQEDLLKLSGLFSFANQSPDSEQRIQYEQRANQDYAGQLSDFLNKLSQGKAKEISSAKINYQDSLADIMAAQQKAQADYENLMWDRQYKMASLNKSGGNDQKQAATYAPNGYYTFNEVDPLTGKKIFYDPKTNTPGFFE